MVNERMEKCPISKSLNSIITRTAHSLSRDGITTSYLDRLVVELLGDETTFAYMLLERLVGERGVSIIARRVIRAIIGAPQAEVVTPKEFYGAMCDMLQRTLHVKRISTVHIIYYAALVESSATAYELKGYGVVAEDIIKMIDSITRGAYGAAIPVAESQSVDGGFVGEVHNIVPRVSKPKRGNPTLKRRSGDGSSGIAHSLVQSIAQHDIPKSLVTMRVSPIDGAMLLAGARYMVVDICRGEVVLYMGGDAPAA